MSHFTATTTKNKPTNLGLDHAPKLPAALETIMDASQSGLQQRLASRCCLRASVSLVSIGTEWGPRIGVRPRGALHSGVLLPRRSTHRLLADYEAVVEACCSAWNGLTAETGRIQSLCAYPYLRRINA